MKTISVVCAAMLMAWMGWALEPSRSLYKIDTARSKVEIHVSRGGLFKVFGHDHTIAALSFSGTVQWDSGEVKDSSVALIIDSASLSVLDPQASEKDRNAAQATMVSPEVLNVPVYPRIMFHSTRVRTIARSGDELDVALTGRLNLHGVEKEITFPIRVLIQKNLLHAIGKASIVQTEFGMLPVKAVGGIVRVKDQLDISFDILAEKTSL